MENQPHPIQDRDRRNSIQEEDKEEQAVGLPKYDPADPDRTDL